MLATTRFLTDTITRETQISAPQSTVWTAISDHRAFGTWFKARIDAPFAPGQPIEGEVFGPGGRAFPFHGRTVAVEPERRLAFDWPAFDPEAGAALLDAPWTHVEFVLTAITDGTRVTVTESGFDALPERVRAAAFRGNATGWEIQGVNLARHVSGRASEAADDTTIRRETRVAAPRDRVWRALADAAEFAQWFGAALDDPFAVGRTSRGIETVAAHPVPFAARVTAMQEGAYLAWEWPAYVPGAGPKEDEPWTLVEFRLVADGDGTRVTVTESGFARFAPDAGGPARAAHSGGWDAQLRSLASHVAD